MTKAQKTLDFVAKNRSIYELAAKDLKTMNNQFNGIVSVFPIHDIYNPKFNFRILGKDYFCKTAEEMNETLNNMGYDQDLNSRLPFTYVNKKISDEYNAQKKEIDAFNDAVLAAREEIINKTLDFLFNNYTRTYIRYGLIPQSEKSYNFRDEYYEEGVSCFDAVKVGRHYVIDVVGSIFFGRRNKQAYEIKGTRLDSTGSDGEPLLTDTEIIKKVGENSVLEIKEYISEIFE